MKKRLEKLVDVKSIITIAMTAVFCYLAVTGMIEITYFMTVFSTVITFYFVAQKKKVAESYDAKDGQEDE